LRRAPGDVIRAAARCRLFHHPRAPETDQRRNRLRKNIRPRCHRCPFPSVEVEDVGNWNFGRITVAEGWLVLFCEIGLEPFFSAFAVASAASCANFSLAVPDDELGGASFAAIALRLFANMLWLRDIELVRQLAISPAHFIE
jgi:hypothetical protein